MKTEGTNVALEVKPVEKPGPPARSPRVGSNPAIRMHATKAWGLALSGSVLALTGIALGLLRYVIPASDAFSAYPHPWWKYLIMGHILATPVFFFFVGGIWWPHAVRHWKNRERRTSGVAVIAFLVVVAATGYLLYFVGEERVVAAVRAAHTIGGIAVTFVYSHHAIMGWRAALASRRRL